MKRRLFVALAAVALFAAAAVGASAQDEKAADARERGVANGTNATIEVTDILTENETEALEDLAVALQAPPGLGSDDPWVDANGDTMFGALQMGPNPVRLNGHDFKATVAGELLFAGDTVCLQDAANCQGQSISGQIPIEVDGSTVLMSTQGCSDGEFWKWTGSSWDCQADQDQDTTYQAGEALELDTSTSPSSFRLTASCADGEVLKQRDIDGDGSVDEWACEADETSSGDITSVEAKSGLDGGGTSGDVALSINTSETQVRVAGSCPSQSAIQEIAQNGTVTCESDADTLDGNDASDFALSGHIHDDRYYTESESDSRFINTGEKASDSDLLDGLDSTDFAESGQACSSGQVADGVDTSGLLTCTPLGWLTGTDTVSLADSTDEVGVGTSSPISKVDVVAPGGFTEDNSDLMRIESDTDEPVAITLNQSLYTWSIGQNQAPDGGNFDEFFIYDHENDASRLTIEKDGEIGLGTHNPDARLHVAGGGIFDENLSVPSHGLCVDNDGSCTPTADGEIDAVAYNTGHSDLAEVYPSEDELQAAEVVALDPQNPGHVERTTQAAQQGPLHVVSTAPGMLLGAPDGEELERAGTSVGEAEVLAGTYPVALSGRVPVQATVENGPIEVGDPLTSASTPGTAMKADPGDPVVGRALESLEAGTGEITVFVSPEPAGEDVAELEAENEQLQDRVEELEAENDELREKLDSLEERIEALEEDR